MGARQLDLSRSALTVERLKAGRVVDYTVAAGGGLLWAACFAQTERAFLPWLALAPLVWLLGRPRALLPAWLNGTVAWLAVFGSLAAAGILWRDPVDWVPGLAGVLVAAAGLIELGDLAYDDLVVKVADPLYRAGVGVSIGLGVGLAVASIDLVRRPGLRTP